MGTQWFCGVDVDSLPRLRTDETQKDQQGKIARMRRNCDDTLAITKNAFVWESIDNGAFVTARLFAP